MSDPYHQTINNFLHETAVELRSGGTYVIEVPVHMEKKEFEALEDYLSRKTAGKNISFTLLDGGTRIAR